MASVRPIYGWSEAAVPTRAARGSIQSTGYKLASLLNIVQLVVAQLVELLEIQGHGCRIAREIKNHLFETKVVLELQRG
jgi:hypothetical protein